MYFGTYVVTEKFKLWKIVHSTSKVEDIIQCHVDTLREVQFLLTA